ncbi:tetratricopeptide repeat protein [Micromonospora soli]|uniref:AfsR/SARP family transcriptional regulator n=1 Tax=Micromonospora sp. NBRC 110009 TaxID=3061627 RepID=UPI00267303E2|nr:tetratricopeptide repeat protein [Micromonospora sp. NBRC 110009]WKU01742.1 tetratricopeptide repeat protein [Micromonospora sp. NBRC 110009]
MEDDGSTGVRLQLLGPIRLWRGAVELSAGPPQRRAVLALLALAAGQPVGRDELVDALWPVEPPRRATNVLQTHVKHLRRVLEPNRPARTASRLLPSAGTAYRLDVDHLTVDLARFRRLVAESRTARRLNDHPRVWELTGEALRLWQPPLADLPMLAENSRIMTLIAEAQLVLSWRVDVAIRESRADEVLALVREEARSRPLDEQTQAHLMRCYTAVGRRAEAFAVFDETRRRLATELGVDPGTLLTAAYEELLEPERRASVAAPPAEFPAITVDPPASAPPPVMPAQLPPDIVAFTGRTEQLHWLDELATAPVRGRPVVAAITGTAGVGKTTLAVHWAHRVAEGFPDGQLHADLRGFDANVGPAPTDEVLRAFLVALGVAPQLIPVDLTTQVGLYRSLLAGRRVLILLDNARRADQIRPLLPGSAGCLVVVTSRNHLPGLVAAGAHSLTLELMTGAEARQLLASRIDSDRVAAAPAAVDHLVAACARLPLALAIVAARASTNPQLPLAALSRELREGSDALTVFSDEDAAFDVRTVFSWSYRLLSADAAALFRLFGLHPGPDISVSAAAALAGSAEGQVRPLLTQLARAHLVMEHRPGRFGCHDLLRAYAAELARTVDPEEARRAALRRVLDHYVRSAALADQLITPNRFPGGPVPPGPPVDPGRTPVRDATGHSGDSEPPADVEAALAWFTMEYRALFALIDQAVEAGFDQAVCDLAWHLTAFLDRRAYWTQQEHVQRAALAAAERLGDSSVRARTHRGLGRAYLRLGRPEDARRELGEALVRYEALGDDAGLATTMMSLADCCERQGRHREALAHLQQALGLYEVVGYQPGEAKALNAVGWCHALLGDHGRALTYCTRSLRLYQRLGDRRGEGHVWDSIGYASYGLGRYGSAARCFQRAVSRFQETADRFEEAMSLTRLGDTCRAAGDPHAGRAYWTQALAILTALGHARAAEVRARLNRAPSSPAVTVAS